MTTINIKERVRAVINSKDRLTPLSSTSGNFTYSFNRNINRITDIVLESVQIPYTFYSFYSSNNVLRVNYGGVTSITITPGNYTTSSLAAELKTQLDTTLSITSTVIFISNTMKFSITTGASAITILSVTTDALSTAASALGFRTDSASLTSVTSDSVVKINGPNYLSICSTFLTKPVNNKTTYANSTYNDVLLTVPVNTGPGGIIISESNYPIKCSYKYEIKTTDVIDFQIKDDLGNILNFNGVDISMQIVFITE